MMMRSSVAQFLRRWRSQYPSATMEKISDSFAGFCLKATLCGVGGYVLGGLATESLSEDDLETEQSAINLHRFADKSERFIEKLEKSKLKWDEIDRSKTSL